MNVRNVVEIVYMPKIVLCVFKKYENFPCSKVETATSKIVPGFAVFL